MTDDIDRLGGGVIDFSNPDADVFNRVRVNGITVAINENGYEIVTDEEESE